MSAAASGEARARQASERAAALRVQAQELLAEAERKDAFAVRVEIGNEGERRVGALLGEGWYVLHDRRKSPRSPANLDHVVVGPPGVFVLDTKNWSGGLLRRDDRGMALGGYRKDDELHSAKVDGALVAGHVQRIRPAAPVVPALVFVQDVGVVGPQRHRDVVLVQAESLLDWLRSHDAVLAPREVWSLGEALDRALPPRTAARATPSRQRRPPAAPPLRPPLSPPRRRPAGRGRARGGAPPRSVQGRGARRRSSGGACRRTTADGVGGRAGRARRGGAARS